MQGALSVVSTLFVMGSPWVLFPDLVPREPESNNLVTPLLDGLLLVWGAPALTVSFSDTTMATDLVSMQLDTVPVQSHAFAG